MGPHTNCTQFPHQPGEARLGRASFVEEVAFLRQGLGSCVPALQRGMQALAVPGGAARLGRAHPGAASERAEAGLGSQRP